MKLKRCCNLSEFFDRREGYISETYPFGHPSEYWITKYGKIKVSLMTDDQIRNLMGLVGENDEWYDYFEQELKRREDENQHREDN